MLYRSEVSFIDEFIANLKIQGVKQIPFDNNEFFAGVEFMASFFYNNRYKLGSVSDELSMLFLKNPLENVYQRFRDALSAENGSFLSFVNPEYRVSILELSEDDAHYIIKKNRSGIPGEFVKQCADEFCKGAHCIVTK